MYIYTVLPFLLLTSKWLHVLLNRDVLCNVIYNMSTEQFKKKKVTGLYQEAGLLVSWITALSLQQAFLLFIDDTGNSFGNICLLSHPADSEQNDNSLE